MGYSNYWFQGRPFTTSEWKKIQMSAAKIFDSAAKQNIKIGTHYITASRIGVDGGCETFELLRFPPIRDIEGDRRSFSSCKTEYLPYDAVVVAILHEARTIAPDAIEVSSDGGSEAIKNVFDEKEKTVDLH